MRDWTHWDSHLHIDPLDSDRWADRLVENMAANGVQMGAISGVSMVTADQDDRVRRAVAKYPQRLLPMLCGVDLNDPSALGRAIAELETGRWAGVGELFLDTFQGMKMSFQDGERTVVRHYPVPRDGAANAVLGGLLEYCTRHGLPLLLHCETPAVLEELLRRHPHSMLLWAHCDYHTPRDEARRILRTHSWLHADFGPSIRCGYWDRQQGASTWLDENIEFWRDMCRDFPDRLLLGTDTVGAKYADPPRYRHIYDSFADFFTPLEAEKAKKITEGNFRRLFDGYLRRAAAHPHPAA